MKENTGAEANAGLAKAEGLICDDEGLVVVGVFQTEGQCSVLMPSCVYSQHGLVPDSHIF